VLGRGSWPEVSRIAEVLRAETAGGFLLLAATVCALIWANSPRSSRYHALASQAFGPDLLHLHLTLTQWAADGLLAIFFFVAGLELKREFVAGDLRDPRVAALPVAAAVSGVVIPALVYLAVAATTDPHAWAVPTATDIAFALAVLAVIGTHLPSALRTFLLTLAVVDDLLAITIIAVFYTHHLELGYLALAVLPLVAFGLLVHRRIHAWWLLLPLALATWALVHASGVHATVAGVLLAFAVPVGPSDGDTHGPAEMFEHTWRPVSTAFAVPAFAFLSAGITVGGLDGLGEALTNRVAVGIVLGLVLGKTVGVFAATFIVARFTKAELDDELAWVDVLGLSVLSGVGFTVSLLIAELAFADDPSSLDHAKAAVLTGSLCAAVVAAVILRMRNAVYRRIEAEESLDFDHDDVPDVFE
jgi:NhaA family Na+:H+ antiporter